MFSSHDATMTTNPIAAVLYKQAKLALSQRLAVKEDGHRQSSQITRPFIPSDAHGEHVYRDSTRYWALPACLCELIRDTLFATRVCASTTPPFVGRASPPESKRGRGGHGDMKRPLNKAAILVLVGPCEGHETEVRLSAATGTVKGNLFPPISLSV